MSEPSVAFRVFLIYGGLFALGAEAIAHFGRDQPRDLLKFRVAVVGKVEVMGDARGHARIAAKESIHAVLVTGENDHQFVALAFHHLKQDFDRFLSVIALVLGAVKVISLVDEKNAAHRPLEHFLGLGRGVADVLTDQVVAGNRDQVPFLGVAETVQDLGHAQRDGRLAGAGVTGETHVQARRRGDETGLASGPVHQEQGGDFLQPGLDRDQPDQIAVELLEHAGDAGLGRFGGKVDGGSGAAFVHGLLT